VIRLLADHPNSGRLTNKRDIRRAVVRPYPYVISTDRTRRGLSSSEFGTPRADSFRAGGL